MQKFKPVFHISPSIAQSLMRIEALKEQISHLPLTPSILKSLRESARLYSTHYSTMIEGNRLTQEQVLNVITSDQKFPGKERDEREVKAYYAALTQVEQWSAKHAPITEQKIQKIHALIMSDGRTRVSPTKYRTGQNVIRESGTRHIVYLPPEARDVPGLMKGLAAWVNQKVVPCPIIAAIAHYQLATIHPYYDGNGRTARLLATFAMHRGGYDLKGIYSLEEYYARNLQGYYEALNIGPSHNYYEGRAQADITSWIEYFCKGIVHSFEKVCVRMKTEKQTGARDASPLFRKLDPKQRKVLELFEVNEIITARDIAQLFGFKPRTSSSLCQKWLAEKFLIIANASKKNRSYSLAPRYKKDLLCQIDSPNHSRMPHKN